jgi:hypothetical protein
MIAWMNQTGVWLGLQILGRREPQVFDSPF